MTDKEVVTVVLAHEYGEQIQSRHIQRPMHEEWEDCWPSWNFEEKEYRVSPNPPN